jgi:hypothetical protein
VAPFVTELAYGFTCLGTFSVVSEGVLAGL